MSSSDSNSKPKINLAILWHQHQPFYKDDGEFLLPWVRFHGTKDYYDMVRILDDFPKIKQNFNLVPSLLIQLQEYLNNSATDRIWKLSIKDPDELTDSDKQEILSNFFKCNIDRMIKPYQRYMELYRLRGENYNAKNFAEVSSKFSYQDWFDLQVWYNMVWIGEYTKYDPPFKWVLEKGRDFDETYKQIVLEDSKEILRKIIPKHKEAQDRGQIEVSFTPFYHPILPLLCDTSVGKISSPDIRLPKHRFKNPIDADNQIRKAVNYYREIFGRELLGMWPSEGSVSEETLSLMAKNGIKWTASDEMVLYNSLKIWNDHNLIYRPYEFNSKNGKIKIIFRDHSLSDLIGFVYSGWSPDDSAHDFIGRIHSIRDYILKNNGKEVLENSLVNIILDGENCWEYYQSDGKDFLRTVYWLLSKDDLIQTTTIGDFILDKSANKNYPRTEKLKTIFPGSWINGNFKIWIGHQEDNKAWDLLSMTRNSLIKTIKTKKIKKEIAEKAWEKIYIAEGSDWNWWYGDEHPTGDIDKFDKLFRKHLISVYNLIKVKVPEELTKHIKLLCEKPEIIYPERFISPVIDGRRTSVNEWQKSGFYEPVSGDSMHRVSGIIKQIYFGYDYDNLYLRINSSAERESDYSFIIHFIEPVEIRLELSPNGFNLNWKNDTRIKLFNYNFKIAFKDFLEVAIPRKEFSLFENSYISFEVVIYQNGKEIERLPKHDLIRFKLESEMDLKSKKKHLIQPMSKSLSSY